MMGDIIKKYYNNTLDNIGDPDSFVWYGMYFEDQDRKTSTRRPDSDPCPQVLAGLVLQPLPLGASKVGLRKGAFVALVSSGIHRFKPSLTRSQTLSPR